MESRKLKQVGVADAFGMAADAFMEETNQAAVIKVGGFWDFIRDVWSKSYERKDWFTSFHVGVLCEDVEECLEKGLNYCAILSRFHLKSTILGHGFAVWSFLKFRQRHFDLSSLYLSYSDSMSQYHIGEIKKAVRRNEVLSEWMQDKVPQSDYSFRYTIGDKSADLLHGGLFSFKRGTHTNVALIADDILRDPDNPLNLSQLAKAEEHFMTESMYIPVGKSIVIVLGTPMAPSDLLIKLRDDERFKYRFLPALDGEARGQKYHVLCPEIFSENQLMAWKRSRPSSFASQMMLTPHYSTQAYINEEEIMKIENPQLVSLDAHMHQEFDSDFTVAGADVGKKRHPSHIVVYSSKKNGKMKQVHQAWLDGWDYVAQVRYLNELAENFGIDVGYFDATRSELEERGLNRAWKSIIFTQKNKFAMAAVLERYVHEGKIEMIADERQRNQIVCVDNELKAPETPLGHGDAMVSNMLAINAYADSVEDNRSTQIIGNVQDIIPTEPRGALVGIPGASILDYNKSVSADVCPSCGHAQGWIPENKLCLICHFKDQQ